MHFRSYEPLLDDWKGSLGYSQHCPGLAYCALTVYAVLSANNRRVNMAERNCIVPRGIKGSW
ncbi:hypothetical protein BDW68DRAFT_171631 [Aspergillus falconensis]